MLAAPIDVAFVGIGEKGHIAFNDPPADFETEESYLIVTLDEVCRRQQLGEGWFPTLADVPRRAISMSVRQVLKSKQILCIVPDARKAKAVKACFDGEISPMAPASILRTHQNTTVFLDRESAALLRPATLASESCIAERSEFHLGRVLSKSWPQNHFRMVSGHAGAMAARALVDTASRRN